MGETEPGKVEPVGVKESWQEQAIQNRIVERFVRLVDAESECHYFLKCRNKRFCSSNRNDWYAVTSDAKRNIDEKTLCLHPLAENTPALVSNVAGIR